MPQIATPEPQASPLRNSASSLPPAPGVSSPLPPAPSSLELGATFPAVMGSPALRSAPVLSNLEEPHDELSSLGRHRGFYGCGDGSRRASRFGAPNLAFTVARRQAHPSCHLRAGSTCPALSQQRRSCETQFAAPRGGRAGSYGDPGGDRSGRQPAIALASLVRASPYSSGPAP